MLGSVESEMGEIPQGIELISLESSGNNADLLADLIWSVGTAAIVVHPFSHDIKASATDYPEESRAQYQRYLERLRASTGKYISLGYPLILFEEQFRFRDLGDTLARLGVDAGKVYAVPTRASDTDLFRTDLRGFVGELKESGLKKAIVLGSYMWLTRFIRPDYRVRDANAPTIARRFKFDGCAGYMVDTLLNSGVYTVTGNATYPRGKEIRPMSNLP